MKDINQFITEKIKRFELTNNERVSLIEIVGNATENIGEDDDINKYEEFRKDCYEDEINSLNDLYEMLEDTHTYPKITNRIMQQNELNALCKLLQYALDKNIVDLSDILEKII